jgi:hypothetical protein
MRFLPAAKAVPARLRSPGIVGLSLMWMLASLALLTYSDLSVERLYRPTLAVGFLHFMNNAMDPLIHLFLSPFAWQWSGNERTMAPFWRAIPQSIAMTLLAHVVLKSPWAYLAPETETVWAPFDASMMILGVGSIILLSLFAGFVIAWSEHLDHLQKATLAKASEAKWTLLRSQMSPHLVLNALNGLAGLVEENTQRAAQGLEDLAELYQQILELGEAATVPLGRERALLERYLAVEQLRLEDRLRVRWEWAEDLDGVQLPPLLLQPLVENAIKHGISPSRNGGELRISSRHIDDRLCLDVSNTGQPLKPEPAHQGGIGLRNLRQRLELGFGERASLALQQKDEWTIATLTLPIPSRMENGVTP